MKSSIWAEDELSDLVERMKLFAKVEHWGLFNRNCGQRIHGKTGRPREICTNRQAAIESGEQHYEGKPCIKCGSTKRYTSFTACVACIAVHGQLKNAEKKRERQAARQSAIADKGAVKGAK